MVSTKFIRQTKQLELLMTQMGQDCLKAIHGCNYALLKQDTIMLQEVDELHEQVTETGRECEQICMRILLLQHPVAKDLRRITVATNTIRDFVRILDQCKEVADLICEQEMMSSLVDQSIEDLFEVAYEMIGQAIEAYVQRDEKVARDLIQYDDKADQAYVYAKNFYVDKLAEKEEEPNVLVNLLLIGKYLERICDHAANIGRWVLYQKNGVFEQ